MSRYIFQVNHWNPYCWMVFLSAMLIQESVQVPASPTERLWEEIGNVKTMMAAVSDELERFNTLYLGKLEYRMLAMASTLSSLDSNVKNLQERAHVWDTFQLHVAAWNDQISTLDKKVDILSRGQEKMVGLDGKVLEVDYKVERVVEKLQQTDSKLNAIGKALDDQKDGYPLFGEFATRGVLSTLKLIERKVDRLQGGLSQHVASHHHNKYFSGKTVRNANGGSLRTEGLSGGEEAVIVGGRGGGKLVIRCNTPAAVEDILKDVASKVDIIFDKVSREGEESNTKSKANAVDERSPEEIRTTDAQEAKLLERLWKRLTSPQKKAARALEALEEAVRTSANTTTALWEDAMSTSEQLLGCCQDTNRAMQDSSRFLHRLESLLLNVALQEETRTETLSSHFQEQKDFLQQKLSEITCKVPPAPAPEIPSQRPTLLPLPDGSGVEIVGSGDDSVEQCGMPLSLESALIVTESSCEELQGVGSGVYHLRGGACDLNPAGRNFFTRYCDMDTNGGGWTVIQRHGDFPGPRLNFTLLWQDYKHGFGSLDQEFWLGNEYIHRLTSSPHGMTLRIDLESFDGRKAWAEYSTFRLNGEIESYQLVVADYTGNATDSFSAHNQVGFSTLDRNNDQAPSCCPCVPAYGGGWWFYSCFEANLNGEYFAPGEPREMFRGLIWEHWLGNESLRRTEMKIRPRQSRESSSHYPDNSPNTEMPNTTDMYIPEDP